jgi:hypothetical protein
MVYNDIAKEVTNLYYAMKYSQCQTNARVTQNLLILTSMNASDVAYNLLQTPGVLDITRGEIFHLFKCMPIDCKPKEDDRCFSDSIPVTCQDKDYFLMAKSHILSPTGIETECSSVMAPMFKIDNVWYSRIGARLIPAHSPIEIESDPQNAFNFKIKRRKSGGFTSSLPVIE